MSASVSILSETVQKNETEEIFSAISEFLTEVAPNVFSGPIDHDTPLLESELDSMTMLQLVIFLGDKVNVEISEEDFSEENFATVGALVSCIAAKRTD